MNSSVVPTMLRLVNTLDSAATTTQAVSRVMKEAEDEAARVFSLRGGTAVATAAADSPHRAFAGARAWLALSQDRQAAGDAQAALGAARAGLAELGANYGARALGVTDDTSIHIDLAEDMAEQGQLPAAARRMIQALDDRLRLYARQHAGAIAA